MAATSPRYPEVVAVVNLKGGVGKTTLCVNLAYGLAFFRGARVLLVDLDPQANATQYLLLDQVYRRDYLRDPPARLTIVDLYNDYQRQYQKDGWSEEQSAPRELERYRSRIWEGRGGYLDLVASKLELGLVALEGGAVQRNGQVRWLLTHVASDYDIVLIDCPPTMSRMLWAGLEAAQSVFVPLRPDYLSTIGLPLLDRVLQRIYPEDVKKRRSWQEELKVLGLAFTMVDERTRMSQESRLEVADYAKRAGHRIFDSVISASTKFTWSAKSKLPIFRSEPSSRYAREIEALVNEFAAALHARRQP
jgi:chromosome partitioning protein